MNFEEGKKEMCCPYGIGRILYHDSWLDGFKLERHIECYSDIEGYHLAVCKGCLLDAEVNKYITDEMKVSDGWHVVVERDEYTRGTLQIDIRDYQIGLNRDIYRDELKEISDKFDDEKQMFDELIDFLPSWLVREFIAENKNFKYE